MKNPYEIKIPAPSSGFCQREDLRQFMIAFKRAARAQQMKGSSTMGVSPRRSGTTLSVTKTK